MTIFTTLGTTPRSSINKRQGQEFAAQPHYLFRAKKKLTMLLKAAMLDGTQTYKILQLKENNRAVPGFMGYLIKWNICIDLKSTIVLLAHSQPGSACFN